LNSVPKIGITMGDPAGIGPEIIRKAYARRLPLHVPVVFGDFVILSNTMKSLPPLKIKTIQSPTEPLLTSKEGINLFPVTDLSPRDIQSGQVNAITGRAAGRYIETAIHAALGGEIDAVVTCPIHKKAFHEGGYPYPGHTEMFAALTDTKRYGMMMVSTPFKVALATIHLPLRDVPKAITQTGLKEIIELTFGAMRRWFGIPDPRICVLGLNPHAGEGGDMGDEETEIIKPVIQKLREKSYRITGPMPADTAFIKRKLKQFDAFVAMYHDQGLIPFKMLAFERGVNVTLGLPFPRVSVDHGTGLDIAGKGIADPTSLRSAIQWAIRFVRQPED